MNQLKNEINILIKCDHKNIIGLYSVFEEDNYIFMLMELSKQGSLYQKLKKQKRFEEKVASRYMRDIVEAINYLHN